MCPRVNSELWVGNVLSLQSLWLCWLWLKVTFSVYSVHPGLWLYTLLPQRVWPYCTCMLSLEINHKPLGYRDYKMMFSHLSKYTLFIPQPGWATNMALHQALHSQWTALSFTQFLEKLGAQVSFSLVSNPPVSSASLLSFSTPLSLFRPVSSFA